MATIEVPDVSPEILAALETRAAAEGRSLNDYLLRQLERMASQLSQEELLGRIVSGPVRDLPPAADVLAAERAAHEDKTE